MRYHQHSAWPLAAAAAQLKSASSLAARDGIINQ